MREINKKMKNGPGFILITMMLFLLVLNLLALSILDVGLLETKMGNFYEDKIKAFYQAEKRLLEVEQRIVAGEEITDNNIAKKIDSDLCGVVFYRLTANVEYNGTKSGVQSTLAKPDASKHCSLKPNIIAGRQSFLVIH